MGRSSRSQASENRTRILDVASGLFRAHGVEAVGIADIMKAAGMTQGGFYKHFDSKDALAVEACALAFDGAERSWRNVANDAGAAGRKGAQAIVDYYLTDKPPESTCPMIAFAPDAARRTTDDPLRETYSSGVQQLYQAFAEFSRKDGSAKAENDTRTMFAAMVGSNMLSKSGSEWSDVLGQSARRSGARAKRRKA